MRRHFLIFFLVFGVLYGAQAQGWLVRETPHFSFVYRTGSEAVLEQMVESADTTYLEVTGLIGIEAPEKAVVLIADSMDDPPFGGFTSTFPRRIVIPVVAGLSYKDVLRHEYTHWLQSWVRGPGMLSVVSGLFGNDLLFGQLGLGPSMVEGTTSLIDGIRASPRNLALVRAAMYDEHMWTYEQGTIGSSYYPYGLRVYLSNLINVGYLYKHYGVETLRSVFGNQSASFPIFDRDSIRKFTGDDPLILWGRALKEFRNDWGTLAQLPRGVLLTPQDTIDVDSWSLPRRTDRGWLVFKSSTGSRSALGFLDIAGRIGSAKESGEGQTPSAGSFGAGTFGETGQEGFAPIEPGTVGPNAFTADKSGNTIVYATAPSLPASRPDSVQYSELWILRLDPDSVSPRVIEGPRKLGTARLSAPALSPDGGVLLAAERVESRQRLVSVDQKTGAVEVLLDYPDTDILSAEISPGGKKAALLVARFGQIDLGLFDMTDKSFKLLTDDSAEEAAPVWRNDHELSFSSDREDSLWSYLWNETTGGFSRLFKEPVASFGAGFLDDGSVVYRSPQSMGQTLFYLPKDKVHEEPLPDFRTLQPSYIATHQAMLSNLRALSPAANAGENASATGMVSGVVANSTPVATTGATIGTGAAASANSGDPAFFDFPGPRYWLPSLGTFANSLGFGAMLYAYDYMGHSQWALRANFVPAYLQADGDFDLQISLDLATFTLAYGQHFQNSDGFWQQRSSVSGSASVRVLDLQLPWGDRWYGDLFAGTGYDYLAASESPFNLIEGFGQALNGQRLTVTGGISLGLGTAAPQLSYSGGPGFWLDAQNWTVPFASGFGKTTDALPLAFRVRSGFQLGLGSDAGLGILAFRAGASSSNEARAGQYLAPTDSAWISPNSYSRMEAKITVAANLGTSDPSTYAFAPVWSTLALSISAGANVRDAAYTQFEMEQAVYVEASYKIGVRAYTNDLPLIVTMALRTPFDRALSVNDIYFSVSFAGFEAGL